MTAPTTQTTRINPDIVDATGALRCVEAAAVFTAAARGQMNRLGARAQQQLRSTTAPIVGEIKAFELAIADCLTRIELLVEEHVVHVKTQAELASDPNLHHAAVGYLDALRRGGIGAPTGGTGGGKAGGSASYEINGNIRGPKEAEKAMRSCADAVGIGQASALAALRNRLLILGVAGASPELLATIHANLVALGKLGNKHADEFARQVAVARNKIAKQKWAAGTQHLGWLDPKNLH